MKNTFDLTRNDVSTRETKSEKIKISAFTIKVIASLLFFGFLIPAAVLSNSPFVVEISVVAVIFFVILFIQHKTK